MFVIPAIVTAAVSEIVYAISATEKNNNSGNRTTTVNPTVPTQEINNTHRHITVEIDPRGHVNDMTDKQIIVFGDKSHPGINSAVVGPTGDYVGWKQQVSQNQLQQSSNIQGEPLAWKACSSLVRSTLPGFTPDFVANIGTDLCFRALHTLATKALPITQDAVVGLVKKFWNIMPKKSKNALPIRSAVKAAKKVANVASQKAMNTTGAMMLNVSAPAAASQVVARGGNPRTRSSMRGITVTHSEMIGTLISNTTTLFYTAGNYVVNPAKADLFPWLSSMATNYDKYRIRRCVVHLVSMQPTSVAGRMGIAYDPDSTDDLPADRAEVYAMYRHAEGPLWQSLALELPVSGKEMFCNTHTTADSKLIDDGQVIVFSDAVVATSSKLADVIVEYTVELLDPQQALFASSLNLMSNISAVSGDIYVPTSSHGPKFATFFTQSSLAYYVVPSPGYYSITIHMYDAGAASPVITIHNGTSNYMYGNKLNSTTHAICKIYVKVSNNSVNTSTDTFVGDYLGVTLSGVANLASLESHKVEITRIAPPIWTTFSTTGWTTTAAAGDL